MARIGHELTVVDSPTFVALLRAVVDTQFGGNQALAAKRAGLTPSHLCRLLQGRIQRVAERIVKKLRRLLNPADRLRFNAAFRPADSKQMLDDWQACIEAELRSLEKPRIGTQWVVSAKELRRETVDQRVSARSRRAIELHALIGYCRAKFGRQVCRAFDARFEADRASQLRRRLAYARALTPLVESAETGFVELHWGELSDTQLLAFLKLGLRREEMLLRPAKVAERPSQTAQWADRTRRDIQYNRRLVGGMLHPDSDHVLFDRSWEDRSWEDRPKRPRD